MRRLGRLLGLTGLLALLTSACSRQSTPPPTDVVSNPLGGLYIEPVVSASGQVVPAQFVDLSFPTYGRVIELSVDEGDVVQAGDPVAQLDTTVLDAQLAASEAALDAAEAKLERLIARAGPMPEEELVVAEPEVPQQRAEVERAQAEVAAARALREQAILTAPFTGTVNRVYLNAYEFAASGQPVIQLADLAHLRVEVLDLTEMDIPRVTVGDRASVTFEALPGERVSGAVTSITTHAADSGGSSFAIVIELDEAPTALRWGMTAYVDMRPD